MKVTKFSTNNIKQPQFSSQHRNVRAYIDISIQQQWGDEPQNTPSFVSCRSTGPLLDLETCVTGKSATFQQLWHKILQLYVICSKQPCHTNSWGQFVLSCSLQ